MRAVYTNERFLPDDASLKMWFALLHDIPYNIASIAVQKYMLTNKFPPTPAEIRELACQVQVGDLPQWGDAWRKVRKAVQTFGGYRQKEALETFDELTRAVVLRIGWADICRSENIGVERANFRMIYEQLANRAYNEIKLPASLQNMIAAERGQIDDSEWQFDDSKGLFASGLQIRHDDREQNDRN